MRVGHQTNLEKRMAAEAGANEDKMRIARRAKELNLDAIHDTVHEMAKTKHATDKDSRASTNVSSRNKR